MKILFIYKSEPDGVTQTLANKIGEGHEVLHFELYKDPVDYKKLLDLVFEAEKVITWW
jgi:hypothetical protein